MKKVFLQSDYYSKIRTGKNGLKPSVKSFISKMEM